MPGEDINGRQNPDTHNDLSRFIHACTPFDFGLRISDCGFERTISNILLAFQSFGALYFGKCISEKA